MIAEATQIGIALFVVVACVLLLGFVVRRLNGGMRPTSSAIRVVANHYLGPKERLLLVQVGERQILVGSNAQCISALAEFSAQEMVDSGITQTQPTDSFLATLQNRLPNFGGRQLPMERE